jgi:enamine deaminase RidA (YjgF/YER057c/UK114 family)
MIDERIAELGLALPEPPKAAGSYVPAVRVGELLHISGQLPLREGGVIARGPVGVACTLDEARTGARQCVLNALAIARRELGTLDKIVRVVQVQGFVFTLPGDAAPCAPTINAASDLLVEIFGEQGRHSRAAVCAAALPLNVAVEILFTLQVAK